MKSTKTVTVRLPSSVYDAAVTAAEGRNTSLADWMRQSAADALAGAREDQRADHRHQELLAAIGRIGEAVDKSSRTLYMEIRALTSEPSAAGGGQ